VTSRYFRFTFDYDASKAGNTLVPLIVAVDETIDQALRKDFGGYVRGSLRQSIIPRPAEPEPEPDPWLGVL
jgi:hypothetical protein